VRNYETLFVLDPTLEEEKLKELVEKFKGVVESFGGQIDNIDEWGRRKLAYKIKQHTEGYYVLMNFRGNPEAAQDLERVFKITDGVIRYLIVRQDD